MHKDPAIKVIAMPKDTNADGDIFGGWILSMMDLAAAIVARSEANGRVVTVAINNMAFLLPVYVGDCIECYGEVARIGNTSIMVRVETWVERRSDNSRHKVTEGEFTFVAIDENRRPRAIKKA